MVNKTVIDMEDKLPQLKEQRKRRARKRLVIYISVFFLAIVGMLYMQSGLSNVKNVEVSGNESLDKENIVRLSNLNEEVNIWNLNKGDRVADIESHDVISRADMSRRGFNTVYIQVEEYETAAYVIDEDNSPVPLLENGALFESASYTPGGAPLLRDFEQEGHIAAVAEELEKMNPSVKERISDIIYSPVQEREDQLIVLMNDGWTVSSTITNFAERMEPYPAVVQEMEPGQEGILHMRINPYFESFDESDSEDEDSL
ncbi:MAG: FtsQ-type POTRA domain-containing protein [Alkalicoccus sp.]|nr:MAG: FtsQ-type POTRA domain-containing protein [Alkalicoccus sp.]